MEQEITYNPTIIEDETNGEILQNGVLEEVITVDEEFTEKRKVFQDTINVLQENLEQPNIGDTLEEYFKTIKALSSWMKDIVNSTLSSSTFLPLSTTVVTDLDIINSSEEVLSKIEIDIISHKQNEYNQISSFLTTSSPQIFSTFDSLWQTFKSLIELGKLKLQELKWVIELTSKIEQVEVEIKKVEAMLEGVEESRKKHLDDDVDGGGNLISNSSPQGSNNSIIIESSSDITVTGIVFSSSLLDEWYTKVVAVEELVQDVDAKVKEVTNILHHERFRSPKDLFDHFNHIINNNVPELRSKIVATKQALAHDRRIARWFDGANDADKLILETFNRVKQLEVPDFINKREWVEEEQNLIFIVDERKKIIEAIHSDSLQFKSIKIDELDRKANDIIATIKDSDDADDRAVVELMTKQLNNLNERLIKLTDFIIRLSLETTTERYSKVLKILNSMEGMRNHMAQIRRTLIEHNDADLVKDDVKDVESQITEFQSELLNDDSALAKALRQKHAKLLLTIQNIRVALAENKLQMAAYLSPSSPTSPTSAGSEFDRLRVTIQNNLESFCERLISPPTYMIDTDNENEEPERIHGLTCNDDHVAENTERYSIIESELTSFERTLWVEFWLKSDPAKRLRGEEVVKLIDDLEKKFVEVKNLMEERKKDLNVIKEGREFAKGINAIRDQLDIVKGKMRRGDTTTTTDTSLQELDAHMVDAQELIQSLKTSYSHLLSSETEDKKYKEAFDEQLNQYNLVMGWIDEVRVWFREAVRIRGWVNERVDILLNVPKVDPFQEGEAPATQEQVDEWQKEYEELEREVEKFDSEDVTRLRAHVKEMVGGDKQMATDEMSPADTMTIGITFETLKILDQLLGKLRNRENELALLALRVQWEREYGTAMNFWNRLIDEINEFIINRGRWKPPVSSESENGWFVNEVQLSQRDVTSELQKINQNILDYIQNTIPPTTEVFDDLFNTSQIEMPEHLIERQENIEERDKEYLEGYFNFANDVLKQRKQLIDYSNETESSFVDGTRLKNELIKEEERPRGGSIEKKFIARVIEFNQRIEKSWKSMAQKIHYPDHEKHDESESEAIRQAVVGYNERLRVLLEENNEALKNYQRALKFVELANEYKKEAERLENWISKKDDYINNRKFDVFQEPCKFTSQDIDDYVSGNSQIVVDIHNFDEEELKVLHQKVSTLISDVKAVGTKCVNTDELEIIMKNLDDKLKGLRDDLQILQSREPDEVDAAKKRLIWEDSLKKSKNFVDSTTKESKEFIVSKASWNPKTPEDTSTREILDQEYSSLEGKVQDYISNEIVENKSNYDAFIDASEKLTDKDRRNYIEARQSKLESNIDKLNEYNTFAHDLLEQRAAVVEYMSEATKMDLNAAEIKKNLIEAEKNVSKGPSEIDFETQLKDFNQNIAALWDERGSKLPYPTSPIMDEVKITKNTAIEEAAKKRISSLESAGEELDKLYETYKSSLELQQRANECLKDSSRLQDWIAGRLKTLEENKIDPLAEECPWSEPEVQKMQEEHEIFLRENAKVDVEDISQVRRQFETLLEDIKKANCKSVDQKPLREALESLNKRFGELQSISSSRQLDLSVLQNRAKWEDQYNPCSNSIDELTNQVNEFISEKARWSPEKANPETDIHQEYTDLKQKVSEFEEKPLSSIKLAYNDMLSSINTYLLKQPPKHISDRQLDFVKRFDFLTERVDLSKQVLNQRDAINTYLNQANFVEKEGQSLREQLKSAEENGEVDPGFTDKLATFKDYLDSLKSDFADKIAYPEDSVSTEDVNAPIKQVVDTRMEELTNLSKELDELFKSYQDTMNLSEELEDVISNYKQLVDELDNFIFDKASWQTQEDQHAVDSVIKNLLAELNDLNKKIADFDRDTVKPINDKVDDYEKIMTAKEKGVPEHIEKKHKKLNEFQNELDALDKYAKDVIDQRKAVMDCMTDGSRLKKEAEQIQQILLSNEPSSPGGRGNTVSDAVNNFASQVQDLCDVISSQIEYPTCSIQNGEKDRIGRTEDSNNLIREAVNAQNESLKSLANSLKELLETHQNVLRRKKMIESYINQADDVASWIQPKLDTLRGILNDETLGELSKDEIHDLIGEVDSIEAARQAYQSAFSFAKSLANKLIEEMTDEIEQGGDDTEDVKADLELVQAKQKEIDTLREELQSDVPKAKSRLDQALQVVDFKEKANEVLNKVNEISNIMSDTPVEDVTNVDIKDWQIKLNNLEQAELFSLIKHHDLVQENLKENYGALSDKESRELDDHLRKVANAIGALKKLMNNKIDEFEAYQSSQIANAYMNRANDLQRWIDDSIATFADSKPKHGIMVGNSDELNKNNFNELTSVYETFIKELPDRVDQLESIRTEFNEISSKEGIRELQDIIKWQTNLDQSWDKLDLATGEFKNFIRKTTDWHYRHESIYHVENEILGGLEERINGLGSIGFDNLEAEVKELDDKIKKAKLILEDAKLKANHIVDDPDDLIDLTNRENFNEHYNEATNRLNELSTSFQVALTAAHNASLLAAFHADANRIISNCYEGTAVVKSRHEDLENSGYYALEVDALGTIIRDAIDGYSESEEKLDKYTQQVNIDLKKDADKLIELNPEANKNRILNIFSKVTTALEQFSDAIALERREIELSRRIHSHAKSAHDIKNWIGSCKMAVLNIQAGGADILDQENEIVDLEEKVANFQSLIDQFKDKSHRVLIPEDGSAEIDAPQPEEINPKIKDAIQTRTNRVLEDWYGLKDLLAHLRTSLNASKESQEVSRSIRDIFQAIGQVKERVLNIESFITGEGVPRLPTKDDVDGGERELDEIQAEVDHILGPRIEALDEMINNLTENDSGYVQQRHGIAEALTNLASIIDTKRTQLREAHNLALFGTKADEMNALMSSLLEVVDLATTVSDGSPLSSLPIIELQARSIELDTKYDYYRPKIQQKFEECKRLAEPLKEDWRVEDRLGILKEQWSELIDVANAKKNELKQLLSGQKPKTRHGRSNSQIMSVRRRGVVSPGVSPSRNPMYRPSTSRTASATPTRLTPSPTPGSPGSPRRPPIRLLPHNVNNYIPDPKDQLDVEVARIVNACPVKIKVSMVDGEPGKYMFGEVDPKLCYCRILRSRMVMVRVGGGWAELSKFLVEHANLEQKYIPKARSFVRSDETESAAGRNEASSSTSIYEKNIPEGYDYRIEGSEDNTSLALKQMKYVRKNQQKICIWAIGLAIFIYYLIALAERNNTWDECRMKDKPFLPAT